MVMSASIELVDTRNEATLLALHSRSLNVPNRCRDDDLPPLQDLQVDSNVLVGRRFHVKSGSNSFRSKSPPPLASRWFVYGAQWMYNGRQ